MSLFFHAQQKKFSWRDALASRPSLLGNDNIVYVANNYFNASGYTINARLTATQKLISVKVSRDGSKIVVSTGQPGDANPKIYVSTNSGASFALLSSAAYFPMNAVAGVSNDATKIMLIGNNLRNTISP